MNTLEKAIIFIVNTLQYFRGQNEPKDSSDRENLRSTKMHSEAFKKISDPHRRDNKSTRCKKSGKSKYKIITNFKKLNTCINNIIKHIVPSGQVLR